MIAPQLQAQLEPVAMRFRRLQLWRGLAVCWGLTALAGAVFLAIYHFTGWRSSWSLPLLALAGVAGAFTVRRLVQGQATDFHWLASQIEQENPELHALLLTAVEQQAKSGGELSYLQQRVISEAIAKAEQARWTDTVSGGRLVLAQTLHLLSLTVLVLVLASMKFSDQRAVAAAAAGRSLDGVTVTPGDAEVEKGSTFVVMVRFDGFVPSAVSLVTGATPESRKSTALAKSLDDPIFGGSLPEVAGDFTYRIDYGHQQTRDFKVKVFEHPKLERADARLVFPEYTGQPEKRIDNTRRVSAVEGTKLDLSLQLNKPVKSARLVSRDKDSIPLVVEANKASAALKDFTLLENKSYDLQLIDADGRTNKLATPFTFLALKNREPELKLAAPRGDQRVSALEEIVFDGEAWDDFGLQAYGIAIAMPGKDTQFVELGKAATANAKQKLHHLLRLEDLGAKPDQLVSYFLWADDVGPDGQPRRTSSDMYFAEVRPFEEIFRQAPAEEGGGGGGGGEQGNQAAKLAELQKQIISATWKLQRQEASATKMKELRQLSP
jgi:hypothetical protein